MNPRLNQSTLFNVNISSGDIYPVKKIGDGSSGVVCAAKWNDKVVAVKIVNTNVQLNTTIDPKAYDRYHASSKKLHDILGILMQARHRNVLPHYGYGKHKIGTSLTFIHFFYVCKWMPRGDLYEFILKHKDEPVEMQYKLRMAHGAARGLAYMHRKGIIHGDFKSSNILLDAQFRIKITDFDRSQLEGKANQYTGTHCWMAPEIVFKDSFNSKQSDVYSLGTVWWEIFAWNRPLKKLEGSKLQYNIDYMTAVNNGIHDPIPSDCPRSIAALIDFAWMQKPERRPTAEEMRQTAKLERRKNKTQEEINAALDVAVDMQLRRAGI